MADPIIFDCGGSTRVKKFDNGHGAMNKLLDVDPNANPPASATQHENGPYTRIRVVTIDYNNPPVLSDFAINPGSAFSFTINSENGQTVQGDGDINGACDITVIGSPNNPPIVEAKELIKKRRYVVINAGAINRVTVTVNGGPQQVTNAAHLYTTLMLTG